MSMRRPAFVRAYPSGAGLPDEGRWLVFRGSELLVQGARGNEVLPYGATPLAGLERPAEAILVGRLGEEAVLACTLAADASLPPGVRPVNLRELHGLVDEAHFAVAGYAAQLIEWLRSSGYCSACGSPCASIVGEWAKRCTSCGRVAYPRVSPCIIVLIHDGEQVLLTHKPGWGPRYSIVAGFVEPGESLEECLVREVREEVGVEVDELRYVGSQPWPFPHQLMVGFFARYRSGEIVLDETELDDGQWFHVTELPQLPPPLSIARKMIDSWAEQVRQSSSARRR